MIRKLVGITEQNSQQRLQDMFASCMKQVIKEVPHNSTAALVPVFPEALNGIIRRIEELRNPNEKKHSASVQNLEELIDVMQELFTRSLFREEPRREELARILVDQVVKQERESLRRKASQCLGVLATTLSEKNLEDILNNFLREVD